MHAALSHAVRARNERGELAVIAELKRRRAEGTDLFRGRSAAEIAGAVSLGRRRGVFGRHQRVVWRQHARMLGEVAAADLGLPILRKDLIRSDRDIEASRRAGASAVLIVFSLVELPQLVDLLQAARERAIEPFVEVAHRREIEALREIHDGIIAINNANIATLERDGDDISRSVALIERNDRRLWVSASRISGAPEVRALVAAGFDGILLGTHLLRAHDLCAETRRIVGAAKRRDRP